MSSIPSFLIRLFASAVFLVKRLVIKLLAFTKLFAALSAWLLLSLLQQPRLYAQSFQPHFINYTTEDGLPSSEVYCSFQDSLGYIWLGTDNGVARFNGYEFTVYDSDDGLEDVVVFTIREDGVGRIWVSTYSGKLYFWDGSCFQPHPLNDQLENWKKRHHVLKLVDADFNGGFLFGVRDRGFLELNAQGDFHWDKVSGTDNTFQYQRIVNSEQPLLNPISEQVKQIRPPWNRGCLMVYDHGLKKWEESYRFVNDFPIYDLISWGSQNNQHLLFQSKTVALVIGEQQKCTRQRPIRELNYHLVLSESVMILGMGHGEGLIVVEKTEDEACFRSKQLLQGHSISYVNFDEAGGVWISTIGSGLFYAPAPSTQVFSVDADLPKETITAIAAYDHFRFFGAFKNKQIRRFDLETGRDSLLNVSANVSPQIFYDSRDEALHGSLIRLSTGVDAEMAKESSIYFSLEQTPLKPSIQFYQQGNGRGRSDLYFGASNYIGRYDLVEQRLIDFFDFSKDSVFLNAHAYLGTADGRHWVGTLHGLYEYLPEQGKLIYNNLGESSLDYRIQSIAALADGSLLFGTRGNGLVYYNSDTCFAIRATQGLASDMVRDIAIRQDNSVWVTSLSGLSKVTFFRNQDNEIQYNLRSFSKAHGLPSQEIIDIDCFEETIWLATNNGVVKFMEPPLEIEAKPPVLERFLVSGKTQEPANWFRFNARENDIGIYYSALDFTQLGKINYRYRLQAERGWTLTQQKTINFLDLRPGNYQFEVQAQNADGYWSASLLLPFKILSPWYLRWPAFLAAGMIGLVLLRLAFIQRDRKRLKEQEIMRQLHQLERSALQAQMNPHFVFNSLTSIQNFILAEDTNTAVDYLAQFARLIRNTLRVSVLGKHSLEQELIMLEDYLELEKLRFSDGFNYQLTVAPDLVPAKIQLPPLLIQPFVENAIKHGLKQDVDGGEVKINFSNGPAELRIQILDNGRGFDLRKSKQDNSFGMRITQRRLELMQKHSSELPPMQIKLRYDNGGQVIGTEVAISIPTEAIAEQHE
ncbi:MAG: histidine kinase [Bacteroidota bacterium]